MVLACNVCGAIKDETLFYKQAGTHRGRHAACIECVKIRSRQYRKDNLEQVLAYDRERGQMARRKETVRLCAPRYKDRKYDKGDPEKRRTNIAVGNAVRDGKLIKPSACSNCGSDDCRIEGHHEDYSKPFDVVWLCRRCHGKTHRQLNEARRQGARS